jgi:6-phosphogluconate dehydrogenase
MKIGMIGLGRMGGNMVKRLMKDGHECVVYDRTPKNVQELAKLGAIAAQSMEDLVDKLSPPRVAWMMVPAGSATEETMMQLSDRMRAGDIIIDGGNSYFKDDVRRASITRKKDIEYADVGTSGGVWGLERGYCLMVGADPKVFKTIEPILKTLAPGKGSIEATKRPSQVSPVSGSLGPNTSDQGYLHCGPTGSGHFVKMIHNGIEYGMMQSLAEGFDIMKNANSKDLPENLRFDLNLGEISEVWRRGSVVSSWLLDLIAIALAENSSLSNFEGHVPDSGEGRWTLQAAIEEAVPADVLSASLYARFRSRQTHTYAEKLLSAMRFQFGGHSENS